MKDKSNWSYRLRELFGLLILPLLAWYSACQAGTELHTAYWYVDSGTESILHVRNSADDAASMDVVVRMKGGFSKHFTVAVGPRQSLEMRLSELVPALSGSGNTWGDGSKSASNLGSLSLTSENGEISAWIMVDSPALNLHYATLLKEEPADYDQLETYAGAWSQPTLTTRGFLSLLSTFDSELIVDVTLGTERRFVSLHPKEAVVIPLADQTQIDTAHAIRIEHLHEKGRSGSLIVDGYLFDEANGMSLPIEVRRVSDSTKNLTPSVLTANVVPIGNVSNVLEDLSERYQSFIVLHNSSDKAITLIPKLTASDGTSTSGYELGLVMMQPRTPALIDVAGAIKAAGGTAHNVLGHLAIVHDGHSQDVVGQIYAIAAGKPSHSFADNLWHASMRSSHHISRIYHAPRSGASPSMSSKIFVRNTSNLTHKPIVLADVIEQEAKTAIMSRYEYSFFLYPEKLVEISGEAILSRFPKDDHNKSFPSLIQGIGFQFFGDTSNFLSSDIVNIDIDRDGTDDAVIMCPIGPPPPTSRCEKVTVSYVPGAIYKACDKALSNVEVRAQSLHPAGVCAVTYSIGDASGSIIAPPHRYSDWVAITAVSGSAFKIEENLGCDVGVIAQVRYAAKR